jgi:tRNA pseudouridine65 synthase
MLPVLYQDDDYLAIHKPAGLLVHRTRLAGEEEEAALQMVREQVGQYVYPAHRLDRPTSGVLLFALHEEAARYLRQQFDGQLVQKEYTAVLRGYTPPSGLIDYPLRKPSDYYATTAAYQSATPQPATTSYTTLSTAELPIPCDRYPTSRYSLVQLRPHTGRTHQLRRHCRHISHPIIGDTRYGKGAHNQLFRDHFGCHRLLLAATRLQLTHGRTGHPLTLTAPLAPEFAAVVEKLFSGNG